MSDYLKACECAPNAEKRCRPGHIECSAALDAFVHPPCAGCVERDQRLAASEAGAAECRALIERAALKDPAGAALLARVDRCEEALRPFAAHAVSDHWADNMHVVGDVTVGNFREARAALSGADAGRSARKSGCSRCGSDVMSLGLCYECAHPEDAGPRIEVERTRDGTPMIVEVFETADGKPTDVEPLPDVRASEVMAQLNDDAGRAGAEEERARLTRECGGEPRVFDSVFELLGGKPQESISAAAFRVAQERGTLVAQLAEANARADGASSKVAALDAYVEELLAKLKDANYWRERWCRERDLALGARDEAKAALAERTRELDGLTRQKFAYQRTLKAVEAAAERGRRAVEDGDGKAAKLCLGEIVGRTMDPECALEAQLRDDELARASEYATAAGRRAAKATLDLDLAREEFAQTLDAERAKVRELQDDQLLNFRAVRGALEERVADLRAKLAAVETKSLEHLTRATIAEGELKALREASMEHAAEINGKLATAEKAIQNALMLKTGSLARLELEQALAQIRSTT